LKRLINIGELLFVLRMTNSIVLLLGVGNKEPPRTRFLSAYIGLSTHFIHNAIAIYDVNKLVQLGGYRTVVGQWCAHA
jgi:hypothetical protein